MRAVQRNAHGHRLAGRHAAVAACADSVTVLTPRRADCRGRLTTLGDALRLVPGFTVARNGGPGTVTSVFPRGGESDYTLVLVDGVRANAFGGGIDLSQVPIADAERIEVVRGPQSALYGSDAIGGVVQIITAQRRSADGRRARARSAAASRARGRASAACRHRQLVRRGRARPTTATTASPAPPADGTPVTNDDSTVAQVAGSLGWRHDGGHRRDRHVVQFVETERGSPGPVRLEPGRQLRRRRPRRRAASRAAARPPLRLIAAARRRGSRGAAARRRRHGGLRPRVPRAAFGSRGETRAHARPRADRRGASSPALWRSAPAATRVARSAAAAPTSPTAPTRCRWSATCWRPSPKRDGSRTARLAVQRRRPRRADHARRPRRPIPRHFRRGRAFRRRHHRVGEPEGDGGVDRRARAARRAAPRRACAPQPAPASGRPTPSTSRSPTTPG